jgi:hypothetical protein
MPGSLVPATTEMDSAFAAPLIPQGATFFTDNMHIRIPPILSGTTMSIDAED